MRIKTLEIVGFKSFKDRVVFHFDEALSSIVGPNGCGKSNVVDAIRWAMGEQSAKHLRGSAMEDVIFNGSESYGPLGMAEVVLTFVNEGDAPAPYSEMAEISIGRRLFRSGESEYLLNKQPCRLMDITDFFLGTGVGTRAYSIIEQGRVGQIVSAKAEDRRALIEEAAGITKYKVKKRAAQRKMEATEQNLVRVRDILGEITKRMAQLERQAKKAEKYKKLRGEMREIDLWSASHRWLELVAIQKLAQGDGERLAGEQAAAEEKLVLEEDAVAALRLALSEREHAIFEVEKERNELENHQKLVASQLEFLLKEAASLEKRNDEHTGEIARLEGVSSQLLSEDEELALAVEEGKAEREALAQDLSSREQTRAAVAQEGARAQSVLDQTRAKVAQVRARLEGCKAEIKALERRRVDLAARAEKATHERDELMRHLQGIEGGLHQSKERLAEVRQRKLALEEKRGTLQSGLASGRERVVELEAQLIALRQNLGDKRARQKTLVEIQERFEGYADGVRAVMKRKEERRDEGILGVVTDFIAAPAHLEPAVEVALADRLQSVLVSDHTAAAAVLEFLKNEKKGRCALIPVSGLRAPRDVAIPAGEGLVGRLVDLVEVDARYAGVAHALLGDVVVVQDLDAALALWRGSETKMRFVTLDGEVIDAAGVVAGGSRQGAGFGLLQKKREIKELGSAIAKLSESYAAAELELRGAQEVVQALHADLDSMRQDAHSQEITIVQGQKDVDRAEGELRRISARLEVLSREEHELGEVGVALASEEQRAVARASEDEVLHMETENQLPDLIQRALEARERLEGVTAEVTELKVRAASLKEKGEATLRARERNARSRKESEERAQKLAQMIEGSVVEVQKREQKADEARAEITRVVGEAAAVAQALEARKGEHEAARGGLLEREAGLRSHREDVAALVEALHGARGRDTESGMSLQHLLQQVLDKYGEELKKHVVDYHHRDPMSPEDAARLQELRAQVEKMGDVNLTAIEEFKELAERQQFLSTQEADLSDALDQLRKAIQKINRTSRERFAETFEAVNKKFQEVFPKLFRGGRAHLELTEAEDMLEAGIEIIAQPPGKKLANINQMSGGEKALTAVALIFSIFLVKPSPFCLLDEVDAPLDEANVGKFNDIVRQMSAHSQFILITHNQRTMEVAETLYGVTMEEPGVSKLVSVELKRKAAAA